MGGTGNGANPRKDPWKWLTSSRWTGIGVIATVVAAVAAVLGLVFSQGGGTTINNQTGSNCAAQGSNNTVNCAAPSVSPNP